MRCPRFWLRTLRGSPAQTIPIRAVIRLRTVADEPFSFQHALKQRFCTAPSLLPDPHPDQNAPLRQHDVKQAVSKSNPENLPSSCSRRTSFLTSGAEIESGGSPGNICEARKVLVMLSAPRKYWIKLSRLADFVNDDAFPRVSVSARLLVGLERDRSRPILVQRSEPRSSYTEFLFNCFAGSSSALPRLRLRAISLQIGYIPAVAYGSHLFV